LMMHGIKILKIFKAALKIKLLKQEWEILNKYRKKR
jgi:hypothetical protein